MKRTTKARERGVAWGISIPLLMHITESSKEKENEKERDTRKRMQEGIEVEILPLDPSGREKEKESC